MQTISDNQIVIDGSQYIPIVRPLLHQYLRSKYRTIYDCFQCKLTVRSILAEWELCCVWKASQQLPNSFNCCEFGPATICMRFRIKQFLKFQFGLFPCVDFACSFLLFNSFDLDFRQWLEVLVWQFILVRLEIRWWELYLLERSTSGIVRVLKERSRFPGEVAEQDYPLIKLTFLRAFLFSWYKNSV